MLSRTFIRVAMSICLVWTLSSSASAGYPEIESFDDDVDVYTPNPNPDYNPFGWSEEPDGDSSLDYGPPEGYAWRELRTGGGGGGNQGGAGVIEEVPNGFAGVASPHGDNFGVIYFEGANGPMGEPSFQRPKLEETWSFQCDVYTDPSYEPTLGVGGGGHLNGSNGIPEFWWTSAVQDVRGAGDYGNYLTESGFTAEILQASVSSPRFWRFTTTEGGNPVVDIPVETWVTMETFYHADAAHPDKLGITNRLWSIDRTEMLYSHTLEYTVGGPDHVFLEPDYAWLGGPLYTWFVYPDANLRRLFVDEVGVGPQIELVPGFILGDMDNDGDVDNFDIQPFELALTDMAAWEAQYGLTDGALRGDIDGDNDFDNFDIQPFEGLLTGGAPLAASAVPEPSTLLLLGIGLAGIAFGPLRRRRMDA